MKLHLPKMLLTAMLSTIAMSHTARSANWDGKVPGNYYIGNGETVEEVDTSNSSYAGPDFHILAGDNDITATIGSIISADTTSLIIGNWNAYSAWAANKERAFKLLTVDDLQFGDGTGSGSVQVEAYDFKEKNYSNTVVINQVSGTLSSVTNAGTLTLGSAVTVSGKQTNTGNVYYTGNVTFKAPDTSTETTHGVNSAYVITGSGTTTFTGNIVTSDILSLQNGAKVVVGGGTSTTTMTIGQLRLVDGNDGVAVFTIKDNAQVKVTNEDQVSGTGACAIVLGHWHYGTGKLNIEGGSLDVLNGSIRMGWDSNSSLNISGGVANVKRIEFRPNEDKDILNLTGGRLNIGTGGIVASALVETYKDNCVVNLTGGTLGVLDKNGWTLDGDLKTTIGTLTIDTNVTDTNTGATITMENVSSSADAGANITVTGNGTLSIAKMNALAASSIHLSGSNATLKRIESKEGEGTLTLTGSGVYDMGDSLESNVSGLDNSETWQGVVSLNGATFDETDLNSYGNENSTIKICNGSGQLKEGVVNAQINFDGNDNTVAYKLTETTGKTITFAGSVCGEGNLVVESNSTTENIDTFIFTGDVSQWKGDFNGFKGGKLIYSGAANVIQNEILSGGNDGSLDVTFKNRSGMVVNGNINASEWSKGTVNLNIENEEGATGEVVINGSISEHNNSGNTNLTVGAGAKAKLTHATSIKLNEVTLKDDATLTVTTSATVKSLSNVVGDQAKASITGKDSGAATLSAVQMSSEGISGISSGSMSNALLEIQAGTTFSIADMTLTNVNINAKSAQVTFNNVTFSNAAVVGTAVMEQTATMSDTNVSGNSFTASTTLLNGLTLESGATLTVDLGDLASLEPMGPGKYNLSITLSGFSMREGSSMLFAADSWLGQLLQEQDAGKYVAGSQALNQLSSLNAVGSTDTPTVSFTAQENVGTLVTITGLSIPEPTTATLSLLALAGLAARRRRK